MTVVITYLASDNARNRRRAKRAADRNTSVTGRSDRVLKAVNAPSVRSKCESTSMCLPEVAKYQAGFRKQTESITAR